MISQHLLNQPNEEDDEFIDDFLDDSMELQESNVNLITKSKLSLRDPKEIILPSSSENKIYQSSPSKLNSKFQSTSKQVIQTSGQKQSNIRPPTIAGKRSIQQLQDSNKPIAQLELNLSVRSLTKVPVDQLNPNLRSLDLRNNKICDLPPELFDLAQLWKLMLDNNLLTALPDKINQLTQLKTLTLSQNSLV